MSLIFVKRRSSERCSVLFRDVQFISDIKNFVFSPKIVLSEFHLIIYNENLFNVYSTHL